MSRVRTLLITPDFPPQRGGIQRLLHGLVEHARDVEYEVVAPAEPAAAEWDARQPFRVTRTPAAPVRPASVAALNMAAVAHARRTRPDVVLCGHVVTAPAALAIRRALGIPYVLYLYALEVPQRPALTRAAARGAAAVVAISRYTAELAHAAGAPADRVHVIPPGVDPAARQNGDDGTARPVILTVARLNDRYKGFDVMVRALPLIRARIPDAEWVVVGDGRLRSEIARQAETAGVAGAVRLCGEVDDAARDAHYEAARVFAMPSRLPPGSAGEGFGIVYLEAATRGVPSVAGDVGGALDAVEHETTGLLVDPTSHLAVSDALAGLLEDPERARRMGAAAARFAERFAWQGVATRVEALLAACAGGRDPLL